MAMMRRAVTWIMRRFGYYPVCPENERICDWGCTDNLKCVRLFGGPGK